MGTLPSSSLLNLNLNLHKYPLSLRLNRSSSPRNLCFICKKNPTIFKSITRFDKLRRFSIGGGGDEDEKRGLSSSTEETNDERPAASSSSSSRPPGFPSDGPVYSSFQVDSIKLMELLGPEKVDPSDVKLIKERLFGYSTFWVTREEPFGDLGEGVLFLGNLRGKREEVFARLQHQLTEITGDKYNLFMVEEPNSEGPDPRGGPRVSFGLLRKEVSEPGATSLWQYVIAILLFVFTIGSCVELGIASQITSLPPELVKYFTDPNATEAPDMQRLIPYVESALPLAYGVLGVQLFHEVGHYLAAFPKKVKLGIPFFIPNITLGSFGAITQFKSVLPDRKTKVDISLAGPLAGAALSFSMFCVGLLLSSNPAGLGDMVQVPSTLFQGSLLLGLLSRGVLGYTFCRSIKFGHLGSWSGAWLGFVLLLVFSR